MSDNMKAIVQEFLQESRENLSQVESQLSQLESSPDNSEILNSIYRTIHTLKGSAGFLGFQKIQEITHEGENLLDLLREGEFSINEAIADNLLASVDIIKSLLQNIESTNEEGEVEFKYLVENLKSLAENQGVLGSSSKAAEGTSSGHLSTPVVSDTQKERDFLEKLSNAPDDSLSEKEPEGQVVSVSELINQGPKTSEAKEDFQVLKQDQNLELLKEVNEDKPAPKLESLIPQSEEGKEEKSLNTTKDSSIRVSVNLLDKIMNVVGELVLNRNQILQLASTSANEYPEIYRLSQQLNAITSELQSDVMTTRMQPVGNVLVKFERVVRDLSRKQGKSVQLQIIGKDTELDKTLLEAISDPLTHLIRNAVDHGIEAPEVRAERGKNEKATIFLKAFHEGGQVNIEISDDGNGISREKVKAKALEKGIYSESELDKFTDKAILNLIFHPGFSTAEQVTNISGRGVGMDVVRTNIEKIGGFVDIHSEEGEGTTFKLRIPLTLAIIPALIVKGGVEHFAIPQVNLVELVRLEDKEVEEIEKIGSSEFFRLRGNLIPILRLSDLLQVAVEDDSNESHESGLNIVILNAEGIQYGLIVDHILDTQEIVVKALSSAIKGLNVYAGSTIMGDGNVALILDAAGFFNKFHASKNTENVVHEDSTHKDLRVEEGSEEILLFKLADGATYGVPLYQINRLEEFNIKDIDMSGNQSIVRYRELPTPLVDMERSMGVHINGSSRDLIEADEESSNTIPCCMVQIEGQLTGLMVMEILDVSFSEGPINQKIVERDCFLGTAFINGKTITIININQLVAKKKSNAKTARPSSHVSDGEKVLLVEDSPMYRKIEEECLLSMGFEVLLAENGEEGLKLLESHPDVKIIVTDIEMPKMNGFEFAEEVKKNEKFKNIPIIALTTRDSATDRTRGLEIGIDEYLAKFNKYEVSETITKLLAG